jgi:hypothetical protein
VDSRQVIRAEAAGILRRDRHVDSVTVRDAYAGRLAALGVVRGAANDDCGRDSVNACGSKSGLLGLKTASHPTGTTVAKL